MGHYPPPPSSFATAWRDGKYLVIPENPSDPDRCFRCGSNDLDFIRVFKLTWMREWVYFVLLAGCILPPLLLVFLLVSYFARSTYKVPVGMCPIHSRRRRIIILLGILANILGIGLLTLSIMEKSGWAGLSSGVFLILSIFIVGNAYEPISLKRVQNEYAWVIGFHTSFLTHLPLWVDPKHQPPNIKPAQ